jgi:glycerophosphoryl diester phosphodiesterase
MVKAVNKSKDSIWRSIILVLVLAVSSGLAAQDRITSCNIKAPNFGVYVVAHRGAHKDIPENSLPAYSKAIELGCDFVEIDVRTTKDGKFVSIHNSSVDKYVSGKKGKVSDLTLAELRSLDIGINHGRKWKGTRIPTFEEILDLCHGKTGIYLDLKAAPVKQLADIVRQHGMEKEIIWYIPASDLGDISELKSSCPECILMPDPGSGKNIKPVHEMFNSCIIATDMGELSPEYVSTAHSNKQLVITDEKKGTQAEWQQIIDWKTDGIQTNSPEELISFLKSRKP